MQKRQKYKLTPKQKFILCDHSLEQQGSSKSHHKSISDIDSIESLYNAIGGHGEIKTKALLMLMMRDWLTNVSSFDPVSGDALHTGIVDFMDVVAKSMIDKPLKEETKDRVFRIVSHTKKAILAIIEHTRDKILREHVMLPIYAAREIDSNSIQWLSRQPGRNIREKLSGKPYIKAVKRRSSLDTSENRLLKAFLLQMEHILIDRQGALNVTAEETCEELLVKIQRWLRSEDASEIRAWGNLPPNNTLLQDKRYRKVWDGWLWLYGLNTDIARDSKRLHRDILCTIYFETLSFLNLSSRFRTAQQPVLLDYDNFNIAPAFPIKGYLFPTPNVRKKGQIKEIYYDRDFGSITTESGDELFFHKNNLSNNLDFNSLKTEVEVSFLIGKNSKGVCANNVHLATGPVSVDFSLLNDKLDIRVGEKEISLQIHAGHLVLIQKPQCITKKFQLKPSELQQLPRVILSLVIDSLLNYSLSHDDQSGSVQTESSIIDLWSIRPKYINNTGSQTILPFRLLQQRWPTSDNSMLVIDCGCAKAIALQPDIATVSMRSLFLNSATISEAVRSSISMNFIAKLRDHITADSLTYLIPDWGNDFDLEYIRKSVNFYFEDSTPLPRSIAAIFAWHSSKKFYQDKVHDKDFVLVVDLSDSGLSITPVQAIYHEELEVILPETHGISWERHPTVIVENDKIQRGMARNLFNDGCQLSEEIIQLFGFDGLISDAGEISVVNGDNWYHLPVYVRKTLNQDLDVNVFSNLIINNCLNSTNRDYIGVNVFILPLEETIKEPELEENYGWLGYDLSPIKGCQSFIEWQKKVADIALWRDHLPELSIRVQSDRGYTDNFYLVKDATVTPQRGKSVNIQVKETFTLPAGQTHYTFPLRQGMGEKELQFVAYLKSPAFPLKESIICKLKMSYTYGADDPYQLNFIPLDLARAGFKSVRVEWRSATENDSIDWANLPFPDFPDRKGWDDFQHFPKEDGESYSNLLEWCSSKLDKLYEILTFDYNQELESLLKSRKIGYFERGKYDRDAKYFCWVRVEGARVFCHSSKFIENIDENTLYLGCQVYLEVDKSAMGQRGLNISFSENTPSALLEKISGKLERMEKGVFSIRFPVLTIWNHGHSLSESDVPDHFRNAILKATQQAQSIIETEKMPELLKEELFFLLSCLHQDAPDIVRIRLLDAVKDKMLLRRYYRNIGFAIGSAELPWQKELLESVINPIDNEGLTRSIALETLSIALWRSKELIFKLTEEELKTLNQNLYGCLETDVQKVMDTGRDYVIATLCRHLELLLALLRTRGKQDEKFNMILAPEKELTKRFITLLDDISKMVIDNEIELKSRISLQIEKPEISRNTPDLLYALRMYLTGDSGANSILISGISEDQ